MKRLTNKLLKLIRLIPIGIYRQALYRGAAAAVEHEPFLMMQNVNGIRYVVDIGANKGQFTLAVRRSIPDAKIVAFEPLAEPASIFWSIFDDDPNVSLHVSAIGPEHCETEMHVSKSNDSSSLLAITDTQSIMFPGTEESHVEKVKAAPLDFFLKTLDITTPALLKIDVQGYELQTLKGCESLLSRFNIIYVECSFIELYQGQALAHQVIDWLKERNFLLSGLTSLAYDRLGQSIQGDFIFFAAKYRIGI
jgi:FkbM family methyltransferase